MPTSGAAKEATAARQARREVRIRMGVGGRSVLEWLAHSYQLLRLK
jgi:hypothetical protein